MFQHKTCCTEAGLRNQADKNLDMYRAVNARLQGRSAECDAALSEVYCAICSPDQDYIFTVQLFETDMLLCPDFADSVFSSCLSATVNGTDVGARFAHGADFLHHVLEGAIHVSVRQRFDCFNPRLPPCQRSDYIGVYSDCVAGTRTAFFQLSPLARCQGGLVNVPPVEHLPCDTTCQSGFFLPVGATACEQCPAGTFSIGGGVRVEDWKEWPHGLTASSYCLDTYSKQTVTDGTCSEWTMNETNFHSGAIGNSLQSVVDVTFELVRDGHISFRWMVDAEFCEGGCDGFSALLDGVFIVNFTSSAPWSTVRVAASKGSHVLTLIYSKDFSISHGLDLAAIDDLEINGLTWADSLCSACPPGSFSGAGARNCSLCSYGTASDRAGTPDACPACPESQYALLGATECIDKPLCTSDDYEALFSNCAGQNLKMSKLYSWISPHICQGGVELPPPELSIDCFPCPRGFRRLPGGDCVGCPDGQRVVGDGCEPCPAGTYGPKNFEVDRWDSWPDWVHHSGSLVTAELTHGCRGVGCLNDWRLMGTHIDSGRGHVFPASVWLNFTVDVEVVPTSFSYNVSFSNCTGDCTAYLQVVRSSDGRVIDSATVSPFTNGRAGIVRILEPGFHSLILTYQAGKRPNLLASPGLFQVHALRLIGIRDGSAFACWPCGNGTASTAQQSQCSKCPAGTFARLSSDEETGRVWPCETCPGNSASFLRGSSECIECGAGSHPSVDHSECETTCIFEASNETRFDLRPLHSSSMYGPIVASPHSYFLSVCERVPVNATPCLDENGDRVNTLLCQTDSARTGINIGDVLSFVPLPPPHHREGFNMTYSHGKKCANGVVRSATISFLCDPEAGRGYPGLPHGHALVEETPCVYEFVWSSVHACPVCSLADMTATFGECSAQTNKQTVSYAWREHPKRCYGGLDLPPTQERSCQPSTTSCRPGEYARAPNQCAPAEAGTFSVGNGEVIVVDSSVPATFEKGCQGSSCSEWSAEKGGILKSGLQVSMLRLSRSVFLSSASVAFEYKYSGGTGAEFSFSVDGVVVLSKKGSSIMLAYEEFSFPLSLGAHSFEWVFRGGASSTATERDRLVLVRGIVLKNSRFAALSPVECPGGFAQNKTGQTSCFRCGLNEWAGVGATNCSQCPPEQYSLPGSRSCIGRLPCSAQDVEAYFQPCVNGRREKRYEAVQPVICFSERLTIPPNSSEVCLAHDCPSGTLLSAETGSCQPCAQGWAPTDGACVRAAPGQAAVPVTSYFEGFQSSSTFGANWRTNCSGLCGTRGWRARSHFMDSGYHLDDEVDSHVTLEKNFSSDGFIEFQYSLDTASDGLDFLIDGKRQEVFRPREGAGKKKYQTEHVKIAVGAGAHSFQWVYHQSEGSQGAVQVERVKVWGVADATGSELVTCPRGFFSSSHASSQCLPCAPGTKSDREGASQCSPCPAGSFQPLAGQTACELCPVGSNSASEGAEFCSHPCTVVAGGRHYNLSSVRSLTVGPLSAPWLVPQLYLFQFCDPIRQTRLCNDTRGRPVPTLVCEIDPATGHGTSAASSVRFEPVPEAASSGALLQAVFSGGSDAACASGEVRSTRVLLECAPGAGTEEVRAELVAAAGACTRVFRASLLAGCRACSGDFSGAGANPDYAAVVSECVSGAQNVTFVRNVACAGPATMTVTVVCAAQLPVPYYGVAAVFGLLVLLVVGVLALVFRNRRMHQSYARLLEEREGSQMGAMAARTPSTSMMDSSVDLEAPGTETL